MPNVLMLEKLFSFSNLSGDVRVIIIFFLPTSFQPTTESFHSSRFLDSRKSWVAALIAISITLPKEDTCPTNLSTINTDLKRYFFQVCL